MYQTPRHLAVGMGTDAMTAFGKASPPLAVSALSVAGVGLQDWVFILTGIYLVLQAAYLVWKWVRELGAKRSGADG